MSDLYIFVLGCFVSLLVAAAVGLLMWGAANEPRGELLPSMKSSDPKPESRSVPVEA
jgi:hypothetical protein